jgi:hypothetical protein
MRARTAALSQTRKLLITTKIVCHKRYVTIQKAEVAEEN